jgi:hypothetical protein
MERALSLAVDELIESDMSTWPDAAIAEEFIALRRDMDRLEAVAARLLVGVHERLVPFCGCELETGVGAVEGRPTLPRSESVVGRGVCL